MPQTQRFSCNGDRGTATGEPVQWVSDFMGVQTPESERPRSACTGRRDVNF